MTNIPSIQRPYTAAVRHRLRQPELPFLQVLLGPRQVGKTTAIAQIAAEWLGPVVSQSADEMSPPSSTWIDMHWERAREAGSRATPCLLALDEVQKVPRWSERVKVLFDRDRHNPCLRVLLSGSASLSLQRGLHESLAGRFELIPCAHWGWDESAAAFGWDFTTWLKFGGYPAAASLIDDKARWQDFIRNSIVEPVVGRDLQTMVAVQKPALLRQLFALAMLYPAQEISYQKLLGQLQDRGNAATIKQYLNILEGGFLLRCLEKYSTNGVQQKSSSPKILPLCPALIHAFSDPSEIDNDPEWRGRVFEVAIGAFLAGLPGDLYYWRDGKHEVDFVRVHNRETIAYEVKSGRRKSTTGLAAFQKNFPKAKIVMIDWDTGRKMLSSPPG